MRLHPWDEVIKQASKYIDKGLQVHQQFSCAHCGAKQTMEEANRFFTLGKCEECNGMTDIVADGHNYMLIVSGSAPGKI